MIIGIAGAGGIGSNVAVNLVRSGVTALRIIDFDRVEQTNLNRQFYFHDQIGSLKINMLAENLLRIKPDLHLEMVNDTLNAANCKAYFADCPIVVEGLDQQADKKILLEQLSGEGRIIVSASGIAGHNLDNIRVQRMGNCYIVGDFITDCSDAPLYSHKVSTVANLMTDIILRHGGYYDRNK